MNLNYFITIVELLLQVNFMSDEQPASPLHSFDSSVELSSFADTSETASIEEIEVARTANHNSQFGCLVSHYQHTPIKKENFLLNPKSNQNVLFVGFQNGWGGKQIKINDSKLKKARMFFEDDQTMEEQPFFSVKFSKKIPKQQINDNILYHQKEIEDFSMPCFKSMGSGLEVKISKQAQSKAKNFLNEMDSFKKPTKLKNPSKILDESLVKTVANQESKLKQRSKKEQVGLKLQSSNLLMVNQRQRLKDIIDMNRKSFNWQQYQKEYRQQIQKKSIGPSPSKKKRDTLSKQKDRKQGVPDSNIEYCFLKLSTLSINPKQQKICSMKLSQQSKLIPTKIFRHQKLSCRILKCVFCKINNNNQNFGINQFYQIMNKQFAKKWINMEIFSPLYHQVCFKLLKYSCYWPQIVNKRSEPSNIIVEINKKLLKIWSDTECSYLKRCMKQDQIGKQINVIVREKIVHNKMELIFLKLSDGWFSVWAAIEGHNILYKYLVDDQKVHIGTKLCLSLWNMHPITNILQFCTSAQPNDLCIQFFYNGSIILKPNAKLGHMNQLFYRPLTKCRIKGGLIPLVEGFIIRLFTVKQMDKKSAQFFHHFAQILTPQGITCFIQFVLGQQNSLIEYFRLYRCYYFYRLKINEQKNLSFSMQNSKFQQIKVCKISEKQLIFPEKIVSLLSKRWLKNKRMEQLQQGQFYDVFLQKGAIHLKNTHKLSIQLQNDKVDKTADILLQQVQLIAKINNTLVFRKEKWSSQLRRLPAIYQTLDKD